MRIVREYSRGKRACEEFRVTVERPNALVGVAAYHAVPISRDGRPPEDHAYISVIGIVERFRRCRKDELRPGDHVLLDVLRAIFRHPRWGPTSAVVALVDPNNDPSCDLFKRHGFIVVMAAPPDDSEADCLFERPPGPLT
jgi:ribosomal protein S18 acetylase RimI-like enzyme